jgi:hypothetical protein
MNTSQDFARCASSHREECRTCARNVNINPVPPEVMRHVWIGPWVIEDQRCPSRVAVEVTP